MRMLASGGRAAADPSDHGCDLSDAGAARVARRIRSRASACSMAWRGFERRAGRHGVRFLPPTCHHRPEVSGGIGRARRAAALCGFLQNARALRFSFTSALITVPRAQDRARLEESSMRKYRVRPQTTSLRPHLSFSPDGAGTPNRGEQAFQGPGTLGLGAAADTSTARMHRPAAQARERQRIDRPPSTSTRPARRAAPTGMAMMAATRPERSCVNTTGSAQQVMPRGSAGLRDRRNLGAVGQERS